MMIQRDMLADLDRAEGLIRKIKIRSLISGLAPSDTLELDNGLVEAAALIVTVQEQRLKQRKVTIRRRV
jgi:hypothetical protein